MSMLLSSGAAITGVQLKISQQKAAQLNRRVHARAEESSEATKSEAKAWVPPALDTSTPSPFYQGGDGGLLNKARVEEFYVIMWESDKEHIFEMPTGGSGVMRIGKNMMKLPRKEQCLALTTLLRTEFKFSPCFWRVFPNGEVQYLHPADGQYPEKKAKREAGDIGVKYRKIVVAAQDYDKMGYDAPLNPGALKFTGKEVFDM